MFGNILKAEHIPYYLTFMSTLIIFITNFKTEIKKRNNETVILKLKEVYNPLYRSLQLLDGGKISDNEVIKQIIIFKSYLLDSTIVELIEDIMEYEKSDFVNSIKDDEYKALTQKLIKMVKKENDTYKALVDKEIKKRIHYDKMPLIKKVIFKTTEFSKNITLVVILFFITFKLYTLIYDMYIQNNKVLDGVAAFIGINVIITIVFYFPIKSSEFDYPLENLFRKRIGKKVEKFNSYESVPVSSEYRCIRCGTTKMHIKYNNFGICHECRKKDKFKPVFFDWKKV